MVRGMNPVLAWVLWWRKRGGKHSEIDWDSIRKAYDYCEEEVEI